MLNADALNESGPKHLGSNAEDAEAQRTQSFFIQNLCVLCASVLYRDVRMPRAQDAQERPIFACFSRDNLRSGCTLIGEESVFKKAAVFCVHLRLKILI